MEIYKQKSGPFVRWIFAAIFLVLFGAEVVLLYIYPDGLAFVNDPIMDIVLSIRDNYLTLIMKGITFLGNPTTMAAICVFLLILPNRLKFGLPLGLATGIGSLCHFGLKILIASPRPDAALQLVSESGFSFPSGHANAGAIFFIFFMILIRRYLIIKGNYSSAYFLTFFFPLLVLLIGASRVYLFVHYPTDVVAGWLLGSVLLIIFITFYDYVWPLKWRITYAPPTWNAMPKSNKNRKWKKPVTHHNDHLIEFPKKRGKWRRPDTTAKRRKAEAENKK